MLLDKFTQVKHSLVYLHKIQQISGLHREIYVVPWEISKGLNAKEIHSDLHFHHSVCFWAVVILCSLLRAFRMFSVLWQWEFVGVSWG